MITGWNNSAFKIIWKSLPPKYNKESIFYYWLFKAVSDLTFDFEIGMGDISKAPTPVSTRINSVFSTLDHSVKLSVYRSVCIFHYFLTWLETLQWPLEGIILVFQMHKIIFLPVPPPIRAIFCYFFAHICVLIPFFLFFFFLRTILLLHIIFFTDVLGITQRIAPPRKTFFIIYSSVGSHIEVFWCLFWGYAPLFLRTVPPSYLIKFCTDIFCDSHCAKTVSELEFLHSTFGPILDIFLNVLENLKYFLDILLECLDITVVVTKIKNMLGLFLLWICLGVFGPIGIMLLCTSNSREYMN